MKTRHLSIITALALALAGCYDDSDLQNRVGAVEDDIKDITAEITEIRTQISQINSNIAALQTIVDALGSNVYVSSVTEVKDQDTQATIGYTILFTDNEMITIYNGTDGEDGAPGADGAQGETGAAGAEGHTPQIGLELANGVYCWTVDGSFLLDADGKAIPATGADGQDGKTPELRINEGYWEIYNGEQWEVLGSATGEVTAVDAVFSGVKETSEGVVFILADGSKIVIPRDVPFGLAFEKTSGYEVAAGSTTRIAYTVNNSTEETVVDAFASGNWSADVTMKDYQSGVVNVTASEDGKDGKVLVYATDGMGKTDIRTLTFGNGILSAVMETREIPAEGGEVSLTVTSNIAYTVQISDNWLSIVPSSKAEPVEETLTLTAGENTTPEQRTATVMVLDPQGTAVQTFSIIQASGIWTAPTFACANFKKYVLDYFDTDGNGELSQEEAGNAEEINLMELSYGAVSSLEGIEALYNLRSLKIDTRYTTTPSSFASADLSRNGSLESIDLQIAALKELNVDGLVNLHTLNIAGSGIETIDISSLTALEYFYAQNSSLSSVDLSENVNLSEISTYGTGISSLDVSKCQELVSLDAGTTTLTSLKLSNPKLERLTVDNSNVSKADFSSLGSLTYFQAYTAAFEEIDLSASPLLEYFYGSGLKNCRVIDVSSAQNLSRFYIASYSALETVRFSKAVEGKFNVSGYWGDGGETYVYVTIEYVEGETVVIDDYTCNMTDEYARKEVLKKFDTDGNGKISESEAAEIKELDLSGYALKNTDGLDMFPLEKLILADNNLTEFDASLFPALTHLDLSQNLLTSINVKSLKKLDYLDISDNDIAGSISYSNLGENFTYLDASGNTGAAIDLSGFYYLVDGNISNTATSTLSVNYLTDLKTLNISGTQISGSITVKSGELNTLDISNTGITEVIITNAAASGSIRHIYAKGSALKLINVGPGNVLADGIVEGVTGFGVLNVTNPTKDIESNIWNNISTFTAGTDAVVKDFNVNYAKTSKGFAINAGGEASITVKAGCKVLKFFAVGVNGTPTVELVRSSGKTILTASTDQSPYGDSYKCTGENPWTVRNNAAAAKDDTNLLIDGDDDWDSFHLSKAYDSSDATEEGETITFKVSGNDGEKVIIFGINISASRDDEE